MSEAVQGEVRPTAPGTSNPPGPAQGEQNARREESASLAQRIARGDVLVVALAFVFAFLIGSILIVIADEDVREAAGYLFARPADTFRAIWDSITGAYSAMFSGAVFDSRAYSRTAEDLAGRGGSGAYVWGPAILAGLRPLLETLTVATPLIIASVGMAVSFRSGLFNIGGTGQLIIGAMAAGYVGFTFSLPPVVHLLACLLAAIIAGGLYGGLAGFLKARFGASEVISTIMLNWIAVYGLAFALTTTAFTGANRAQPTSPGVGENAVLPQIAGSSSRLHLGLLIAILAIVFLWWLMSRSTLGFRFRAVGSNPRAAEVAGIDVGRSAVGVMFVAGALVGLAGGVHILGTEHRLTGNVAGSIGFDAITVALLGRSGPVGILLAGVLFAGLSTGGRVMETNQEVPLDLVQVIQALVVLFIAAPPLVRYLVGLRSVDQPGRSRRARGRRAGSTAGVPASVAAASATGAPAAPDASAPATGQTHRADAAPAAGTTGAPPDAPVSRPTSAPDPRTDGTSPKGGAA